MQRQDFRRSTNCFARSYAYFSSVSTSWLAHAKHYADQMVPYPASARRARSVEVASNDGYLLQYFKERNIPVLGIEPCRSVADYAVEKKAHRHANRVLRSRDGQGSATEGFAADLTVANNVLAHVSDMNDFVSGFAALLEPEGVATFEFPHLLALIRLNAFNTIYHEHSRTSPCWRRRGSSRPTACASLDVEQLSTHGGSLRLFACHTSSARQRTARVDEVLDMERAAGLDTDKPYRAFAEQVRETKRSLLELLIGLKRQGKSIAGYGAAAKGNTLLNYCGVGADVLDFVVDRSPHKQGLFLPGTRLEIRAPEAIDQCRPDYVMVLPWNLQEEVTAQLARIAQWGGRFIVPIPKARIIETQVSG